MPEANIRTTKFSMEKDEKIRALGLKAHRVAVLVKEAGFAVRSIRHANSLMIRKAHNLKKDNNYSILEFAYQDEEKNMEVVDWLNLNTTNIKVIDSVEFDYPDKTKGFRVVVDCTKA